MKLQDIHARLEKSQNVLPSLAHLKKYYSLHKAERISKTNTTKEVEQSVALFPGFIVAARILKVEKTTAGEVLAAQVQVQEIEAALQNSKGVDILSSLEIPAEQIMIFRISAEQLYDPELVHLSDEIDLLKVGDRVRALVKPGGGLSLRNSGIYGKQQINLKQKVLESKWRDKHAECRFALRLGKCADKRPVDLQELNNASIRLGIHQHGTFYENKDCYIFQEVDSFDYIKLREIQNYEWADWCLAEANRKMEQERPEQAVKMCDWALDLDPLNAEMLAKRGEIKAYYQGRLADGKDDLESALKMDPKNSVIRQALGDIEEKFRRVTR